MFFAAEAIPLPFELRSPIGKTVDLIQHQGGRSTLRPGFGICPAPLPKTGKRGTGIIACGINRLIGKLLGELQQKGSFADLPGPSQDLNSPRSGLLEPLVQYLTAVGVAIL